MLTAESSPPQSAGFVIGNQLARLLSDSGVADLPTTCLLRPCFQVHHRTVRERWVALTLTEDAHDVSEREVRDLPCMEFRTTVVVAISRVCCPNCGIKIEKVPQLPSNAPFSKRFEDAVGQARESAAARQMALRIRSGVEHGAGNRSMDMRYLERWSAVRRKPALVKMGVDEIHLAEKKQKFVTVVSNLDANEPVWFGRERKKETLDEFSRRN